MKLKTPKLKIKLVAIFWLIFLLVVAVEILVLYKYLYLPLWQEPEASLLVETPASVINEAGLEELRSWLQKREDYEFPDYELKQTEDLGRENPFLEYR